MLTALHVVIFGLGFFGALVASYNSNINRSDIQKLLRHLQSVCGATKAGESQEAEKAFESISATILHPGRNEQEATRLLTRSDIEQRYNMNTWQRQAYEEFKNVILANGQGLATFPCIYATIGFRSDNHRYVFLESDNPSEPRNIRIIAPKLKAYLDISKTLGPNTSLVIFGAPSSSQKSVAEYNNNFWQTLRGLRISDPEQWPSHVPQDVDSANWEFCFNGQTIFPVSLTPAHQRRLSRHASVPTIALQPKWVFDRLLGTPESRKSSTGKVRKLLADYDEVEVSPNVTTDPGVSGIHELCLNDENELADCPYSDFDR